MVHAKNGGQRQEYLCIEKMGVQHLLQVQYCLIQRVYFTHYTFQHYTTADTFNGKLTAKALITSPLKIAGRKQIWNQMVCMVPWIRGFPVALVRDRKPLNPGYLHGSQNLALVSSFVNSAKVLKYASNALLVYTNTANKMFFYSLVNAVHTPLDSQQN